MNHDWSCRHCEHWRLGPLGPPASYFSLAPTCALGFKPSLVRSIKSCAHYSREPGADDEMDTLPEATSAPVRPLPPRGATHA